MRLDKYISHSTGLSRTLSRRAIKKATVSVNGIVQRDAASDVSSSDRVTLDDEVLHLPGQRYVMLHKPSGYVCATEDGEHPTVLDLLSDLPERERAGLSIAGRLDKDTTGLVLLSDDGQWIHRLTSPRHAHNKHYIAQVEQPISEDDCRAFADGIMLRNEDRPTRPALLKPLPDGRAEVIISEGRYHQVKRMFAARGNRVVGLHRQQIGPLVLDPALEAGQYRPLSEKELAALHD